MNLTLAWHMAWRSLRHHLSVSLATILGVGLGMLVIATILIVDANSTDQPIPHRLVELEGTVKQAEHPSRPAIRLYFERREGSKTRYPGLVPTQTGAAAIADDSPSTRRGEEDYQAMRLAVRLAALLAFAVGAVIVFYTMTFSVSARTRELALLLCLGEQRRSLVFALVLEAGVMGAFGTLLGLLLAGPAALTMLAAGVSTTGRVPDHAFTLPIFDLAIIAALGVGIALLGVVTPARRLFRLDIEEVLQPRFLTPSSENPHSMMKGFLWLIAPLSAALWISVRPFVQSWLSVVHFFLVETAVVLLLAGALLWWTPPLLRAVIRLVEWLLRLTSPLDALLVGRRMRLVSEKLVFTIAAVTLVFAMVTALNDVTGALKHEIRTWASQALHPYVYFYRSQVLPEKKEADFLAYLKARDIQIFRLSEKAAGELSLRLIDRRDINAVSRAAGHPPLTDTGFVLSKTLAARFGVSPGDRLVIDTGDARYRFELIMVSDEVGFFAEDGQYVDLKSYALFADGHPLFSGNLAATLGKYAMARKTDGSSFTEADIHALYPYYRYHRRGSNQGRWQLSEIDRDFLIFDFVLMATVLLAAIGVANSLLIQVHARERELAVLRTLGLSRAQRLRMLLTEGAIIGMVSALLALILGHLLGWVSVTFLDRFTLFDYELVISASTSLATGATTMLACTAAAVYPALVADRVSSAESLQYE